MNSVTSASANGARWSILMAYYNEEEFLRDTLLSLVAQSYRPVDIILVDNASKDASAAIAREVLSGIDGINPVLLDQPIAGQINALNLGLKAVKTEFVAICDADTFYPPHYLDECDRAFARGGSRLVGVMATDIYAEPSTPAGRLKRLHVWLASRILSKQAHTGGYAYAFRTDALRAVGGYDVDKWPYVLSDHEIVHRMLKRGRTTYPIGHWCMPSTRRPDDPAVRWSLVERLLYHFTPFPAKDWFFYRFLANRFERRRMGHTNYRDRPWDKPSQE